MYKILLKTLLRIRSIAGGLLAVFLLIWLAMTLLQYHVLFKKEKYNKFHLSQRLLEIIKMRGRLLTDNVLDTYYANLGVNVSKFLIEGNMNKYFKSIASGKTVNITQPYELKLYHDMQLGRVKNTTNNTDTLAHFRLLSHYILRYPQFNRSLPNFIDKRDKDIFLSVSSYMDELKPRTRAQLKGHIGLIYGAAMDKEVDCGWRNNLIDYQHSPPHPSPSSQYVLNTDENEVIIPLLVPGANSFQHFLDGVLPKIVQVYPYLSNPAVKILIYEHRGSDRIISELLQKLGVSSDRVLNADQYMSGTLGIQLNTCLTPPTHPLLWGKMRELIGVQQHLKTPLKQASVILLTRAKSHNGGRNIVNHQQVVSYLTQRYRNKLVVFTGGYNLNTSLDIFGKARLMIGVHGGAFYNLNFCPQEAVLVEYIAGTPDNPLPNPGLAHGIIWSMAGMIGQTYYRVYEKPVNYVQDIQVNLNKLKVVLDRVDSQQHVL